MIGPHIAEILFATVTSIDDHSVAQSHCCMAVPDWRAGTLHVWSMPGVRVHIKDSDVIQVRLRQSSGGSLHGMNYSSHTCQLLSKAVLWVMTLFVAGCFLHDHGVKHCSFRLHTSLLSHRQNMVHNGGADQCTSGTTSCLRGNAARSGGKGVCRPWQAHPRGPHVLQRPPCDCLQELLYGSLCMHKFVRGMACNALACANLWT